MLLHPILNARISVHRTRESHELGHTLLLQVVDNQMLAHALTIGKIETYPMKERTGVPLLGDV